jgi:hypothetical protein
VHDLPSLEIEDHKSIEHSIFGIHRANVRCATSKPSLRSSPWIRGAPQKPFSRAILLGSASSSAGATHQPQDL